MRVVLDTVIYVRALINPIGRWGRLVLEIARRHIVITSPEIIREVIEVLHRQEVRDKLPLLEYSVRLEVILATLQEAEVVEPADRPPVCRDADDDKFFWCAAAGSADYIISEDKDILSVGEYRGAKTISADAFMTLAAEQELQG
jgi:putative PIN family toxin of toxin-antitoxin system